MRSTFLTIGMLLVTACAGGSAPPAGLTTEDVAAIKNTERRWVQAVLAGDGSAGLALHTADAVRMPPNERDIRGRAALEAALRGAAKPPTAFTLTSTEIDGRGDLAYAVETFSITLPGAKETTKPVTQTGRGLVIMRKQPDGSWLASRVIWNSDQPAPK
ncbi:MAG: DUF4440 domain-containing protein [Candidatus Eisenbacteria bacterium]|uniref:DUF4440 domain-containing protein n=1 Tax=Eiseniibacteriota bacterium TaxID=2212470 RepID=A0A538S798_UNCEI|nr:MAG: DUF4440 domain-containing protein [Candidatus Eisenbacteria bacterium]